MASCLFIIVHPGTVTQTVDLMRKYNFFITAMNQVEVTHCLAALPNARLENISVVYSHPQALSQCSDFLNAYQLPRRNTAIRQLQQTWWQIRAIQPLRRSVRKNAQNRNKLTVLAPHISNVVPNYTQFICITKDMQVAQDASIISVMLTLSNEPGSLSRILNKFFLYGLDMTKLESRPIRDGSFDVIFHIDFKGNLRSRDIAAFLNDLCKSCQEFKLLGNAAVM